MAWSVKLRHKDTGTPKVGWLGWSWTSFFFGFFPAAIRGDWFATLIYIVVVLVLTVLTAGIGSLIFQIAWCIWYNKWYTKRLIEKRGYELVGDDHDMQMAQRALFG